MKYTVINEMYTVNKYVDIKFYIFFNLKIILLSIADGNDSDDLIVQAFKAYDLEGRYLLSTVSYCPACDSNGPS